MKNKVVIVSGMPPNPEGESNYCYNVFRGRTHNSFEFHFISHKENTAHAFKDTEKNIIRCTDKETPHFNFLKILRVILKIKPKVVHFQGVHTHLYGGKFGEPMIFLFIALKILNIKIIHTVHSTWLSHNLNDFFHEKKISKIKQISFRLYLRLITKIMNDLPNENRILVAGDKSPVFSKFINEYGIKNKNCLQELHPCGAEFINDNVKHKLKVKLGFKEEFIILTSGFIRPDKGIETLILAFNEFLKSKPSSRLIIAGNPVGNINIKYSNKLIRLVEKLHLASKTTLKFEYVPEQKLSELNKACDVVVTPYKRAIGASGPIHKAMSNGKQVIASAVDHNLGLSNVITLFDDKVIGSLEKALGDSFINKKMNEKKVISYSNNHLWSKMFNSYIESYERLV